MIRDGGITSQLEVFDRYVAGLGPVLKRQYDRSVNRDLSRQQWQDLFKRNITSVLKQTYQEALKELRGLSLNSAMEELSTAEILRPFEGMIEELMQYALQKHRSSCAMSNFPQEHNPSREYIADVVLATKRDWAEFATEVGQVISDT